jgi:hypothetical protein
MEASYREVGTELSYRPASICSLAVRYESYSYSVPSPHRLVLKFQHRPDEKNSSFYLHSC